jgi:hypothetical protein
LMAAAATQVTRSDAARASSPNALRANTSVRRGSTRAQRPAPEQSTRRIARGPGAPGCALLGV